MINSQMLNPFMVGDLVHIPQGVTLYELTPNSRWSTNSLLPERVLDSPVVGLIMGKHERSNCYRVSIGQSEYQIRNEDMTLITRKDN